MTPILNHIISFARAPTIDAYLERYSRAGFVVDKRTIRHEPGKRNGFVHFGPEYLEFFWVEDAKRFNAQAPSYFKEFRTKPRPFGIALDSRDVDAFHRFAARTGFKLPQVWSKPMSGSVDTEPWWAFQDVPLRYLPGAWTFILTYLRRDWKKPLRVRVGRNTIYGLTGVTFITPKPYERAAQWQRFIGEKGRKAEKTNFGAQLVHGPHRLEWMTPTTYVKKYGAVRSPVTSQKFKTMQEIALVHLVARYVKKARSMVEQSGFKTASHAQGFFIKPDARDGFAFLVSEQKPAVWAKGRSQYRTVTFTRP